MNYNTGTIKLCMRSGEVTGERKYESVQQRKYEMGVWGKRYGPAFFHCHYLICPDVDIEAIDDKGGNIRKGGRWHRKIIFADVKKGVA